MIVDGQINKGKFEPHVSSIFFYYYYFSKCTTETTTSDLVRLSLYVLKDHLFSVIYLIKNIFHNMPVSFAEVVVNLLAPAT